MRVLITAGASGVGRAMAEAFDTAGAQVWVADVDPEALATCPQGWGQSAVDVSNEAEIADLIEFFEPLPFPNVVAALSSGKTRQRQEHTVVLSSGRTRQRQEHTVFVNHTGQDQAAADLAGLLHKELERCGIHTFLDSRDIATRDMWKSKIEAGVLGCKVFVCIVTPSYFSRYWCLHELDLALGHGKEILVVFHGGGDIPKVNADLQQLLRKVLENKLGRVVDQPLLNRWCRNVQELDGIQGVRGLSNHKHYLVDFVEEIVVEVKKAL